MPLAEISQIPQTANDWKSWAFAHMANHRDICRIVNTSGTGGSLTASFNSVGGNEYQLVGGSVTEGGSGYWQPAQATWSADAANCNWISDSAPTIALTTSDGVITAIEFMATSSNPNALYQTASPNVGVTPTLNISPALNLLQEYPLYPIDLNNLGIWLYQHQTMHSEMDLVFGIAGYNLLELDWTDPDQLADWISFNIDEHIQVCRFLGIG